MLVDSVDTRAPPAGAAAGGECIFARRQLSSRCRRGCEVARRLAFTAPMTAALLTILFAASLARPLGVPTGAQLVALVVMEVLLIAVVAQRPLRRDERRGELAVLLIVGEHFLPMMLAFGPLIGLLGVLSALNASSGLWWSRTAPLRAFWTVDGVLKATIGGAMLFSA